MSREIRTRSILRSPFALIVGLIAAWFVTAFLIWPNISVFANVFVPNGHFTLQAFSELFSSNIVKQSLVNSLVLAVALALSTNIVGLFIVLVTKYFRVRGSRILWLGYATTFIYGGIVLATGYKAIYGSGGIVTNWVLAVIPGFPSNWFSGFPAVLITMTLATTTNHMLFVSAAINRIDQQNIDAARLMGAGSWRILRTIIFPALKPVLIAVTILSFLTGLGALSAPQVLGGTTFQTVAPIILVLSGSPVSRDVATLLALLLGIATLILLVTLTRVERGGTAFSVSRVSAQLQKQPLTSRTGRTAVHILAYALFVAYVLPVLLIVVFTFLPADAVTTGTTNFTQLTLGNYIRVLGQGDALRPLLVSLTYSFLAALITVGGMIFVVRVITQYRNWFTRLLEGLFYIPWVLPATLAAIGLIVAFDHPTAILGGYVLTGTTVILLIAYIIAKIPFTLRLLRSAFSTLDQSTEEAAENLGASPFRILRQVVLPAVFPVAIAIFALNFNSLLDDYDLSVYLANPLYQPLGIVLRANTDSAASLDAVSNNFVYTVLLMVVTGAVMALVYGRPVGRGKQRRRRAGKTAPAQELHRPKPSPALEEAR